MRLMRSGLTLLPAAAALLVTALTAPSVAETRSAALAVRVIVVRGCSVQSRGGTTTQASVTLTCSRGTEPGVVSTVSGGTQSVTRIVPVPARQTTVVATRPALSVMMANPPATMPAVRAALPARQVVTVNF
jgi:hypothetical protein